MCAGDTKTYLIHVQCLFIIIDKPELIKMEAITVRPSINGEAILTCWFTGHPLVTSLYAAWTKDGKSLAQTTHYSISYETDLYTGIGILKLKIAGVEPQDYGVYQCNASNLYGYATGKTKLLGRYYLGMVELMFMVIIFKYEAVVH